VSAPTGVVDEQAGHASDHRAERQILNHLLICAESRSKKADDFDRSVGMALQDIEQVWL
jgi:hypothetical protein